MKETFYIGIKGSVVAMERKTGRQVWRKKLTGLAFVVVVLDGDVLLAHTRGELFGLDPKSGEVLWQNGLEGLGYGHVTMTSENMIASQSQAAILSMQQQAES